MKPLCHLFTCIFLLLFLATPLNAQNIDNRTTTSWIGFGSVAGSYLTKSGNKSVGLTGDSLEIMLWQDIESSGFFDGLQLLQLKLAGTGIDGSGISHEPKLELLNLQYHLGWNWNLFNLVHLQFFTSYGIGQTRFSVALQRGTVWSNKFEEQQTYSDMISYGINLIFELTDRLWFGYSSVRLRDSQSVDYGYTQSTFAPTDYQSVLLVYKWAAPHQNQRGQEVTSTNR